jgi:hypothetical protein
VEGDFRLKVGIRFLAIVATQQKLSRLEVKLQKRNDCSQFHVAK